MRKISFEFDEDINVKEILIFREEKSDMKIGMTSLTLRKESVENVIKYASGAGLSGIEWGVSDLHMPLCDKERAEKIKKLSAESGLEIFSLGSYCRMLTKEEMDNAVETAVLLGAPVIRVWAGEKSPSDGDCEYRQKIADNAKYMSEQAAKHNIRIGFEYHRNTLTENAESAVDLMKKIDCDNVGLYWQPRGVLTPEENHRELLFVTPYLIGNLHVHNHNDEQGYQSLSLIEDKLRLYYNDIKDKPYNLMIEFVKDGSIENLLSDSKVLQSIVL